MNEFKPPEIEIIKATEAVDHSPMNTIGKNGEQAPMLACLITDVIIEKAKLKPVANPVPFTVGTIPTEDGIYSNEIFGDTAEERRRNIAYIDLKKKFIHPYVYETLKKIFRKIDNICDGIGYYKIVDGVLENASPDDKDFDENATGLDWFIDHFYEIDFSKGGGDSISRNDKIKFIKGLTKEEIFISKWPVIPVFYRDVMDKGGRIAIPDISKSYNRLISLTMGLDDNPFAFMNNKQMFAIQTLLIEIRTYGGDLIRGKHGKLRKSILGKSIDRGSGDVISQMPLIDFDRPDECNVDPFHTGQPLSKCIVLGYDFIIKYCLDFFENNFKDRKFITSMKNGERNQIPILNQLTIYTKDYLTKMMTQYINTPSMRFDPIPIYTADGKTVNFRLSGQFKRMNVEDPDNASIISRDMTWTDLFYMAAYDTLSNKYLYITRFPTTSINSTFPSLCEPLATIKTTPAVINGITYNNYPVIDLNYPKDQIVTLFIDTQCMSDLMLDIMGGDYDGDKTQSKLAFSEEANIEAKEISESLKNFLDVNGSIIRKISKEATLCFFNMTDHD